MWYRTGPGGMMRFSGIFSGPNNLGYMMVALFPVACLFLFQQGTNPLGSAVSPLSGGTNKGPRNLSLPVAMIVTTIATFSRAAMGAMFLEILVLIYIYKKAWRSYIYILFSLGIIAGIGLLSWKR
jgi:hypothetical protein